MKDLFIKASFILLTVNLSFSQAWMTNLEIAQKLALIQNKMVLMVWEESTKYPYHVLVKDDRGKTIFIRNLFEDENISPLIWENFIPVIVSENQYADLYLKIKGKRKLSYIDKFNDDSIKILDVNGNILNATDFSENYTNITDLITKYSLNTEFLTHELIAYQNKKDFYSAYFLASKYLDFALYAKPKLRENIVALSNIYLNEAVAFLADVKDEDPKVLKQRTDLLKIQEYLVLKRPKKALRLLKKMKADTIENNNKNIVAFLYYTAYMSKGDNEKADLWKSKISLVNLKKAAMLINLNS